MCFVCLKLRHETQYRCGNVAFYLPLNVDGSALHCSPKTAVGFSVMESRPFQLCVVSNAERERDVRIITVNELKKN